MNNIAPAFTIWICGNPECNSELTEVGDYLDCESCGCRFSPDNSGRARYLGDDEQED